MTNDYFQRSSNMNKEINNSAIMLSFFFGGTYNDHEGILNKDLLCNKVRVKFFNLIYLPIKIIFFLIIENIYVHMAIL